VGAISPEQVSQSVGVAAIYVRVSSTGQLGRDGDEDGYSIPAQIAACERKAADLGLSMAQAYIERAESARSDDRPVLQQMMRELPDLGVTHLIVHKVDRLARNRLDDATLYERLVASGITLVSASENIDATPAGRLMHGMLATFAEYYSNNLATEIKKGLGQKHKLGGTPFKPPTGYEPKRDLVQGQDIRWVETDSERAPLVTLAFDLYASGEWSTIALTEHLAQLGLTTRPTAKTPARPLSISSVHRMLRNRYYLGEVTYRGETVLGRHDPLVTHETFEKVQVLLTASRNGRDRPQVHEQYLTGSLYCAECGSRLVFSRIKNRHGKVYDYFCCLGRKSRKRGGSCTTGHYSVAEVERAVERLYRAVRIDPGTQEAIRLDLVEHLEAEQSVVRSEIARHEKRIERIKTKQAKLLELAYEDLVSKDVLRDEQERLRAEERAIDNLIRQAQSGGDGLLAALDEALDRHRDPERGYVESDPLHRRAMNRLMFERIEVGPDDEVIEAVVLAPVVEVIRQWDPELIGPDWTPGTGRAGPSGPSSGPSLGTGFDLPVASSTSVT
jgi:DNA invertase Pin-like site-specific DNA recombinase